MFVPEGSSPTEGGGGSFGGVLVGRALVLIPISALAIFSLVIIALWPFGWFTAERFV
jgi:hypothetical protein